MRISKERTIAELAQDFHTTFPGLKLRFYKKEHQEHEGSPKGTEHPSHLTLGAINPEVPSGEILLTGDRTVTSFEGELEERFGLHAQVFRRSKNLWLQTTSTDYWSLATQNQRGLHTVQAI